MLLLSREFRTSTLNTCLEPLNKACVRWRGYTLPATEEAEPKSKAKAKAKSGAGGRRHTVVEYSRSYTSLAAVPVTQHA